MTAKGRRKTKKDVTDGRWLARDVIQFHGQDTEESELSIQDILKPFKDSQALAGKPKIFLIQLCQEVIDFCLTFFLFIHNDNYSILYMICV